MARTFAFVALSVLTMSTAGAQDYSAITPYDWAGAGASSEILPIGDGDFVLSELRKTDTALALHVERRRADLSVVWALDQPLPVLEARVLDSRAMFVNSPAQIPADYGQSSLRVGWGVVAVVGASTLLFSHEGGHLLARPLDLEAGALGSARDLGEMNPPVYEDRSASLLPSAPSGLRMARPDLAISPGGGWLVVGAPGKKGPVARILNAELKPIREQELAGFIVGPGHISIDQAGILTLVGANERGGGRALRIPPKGAKTIVDTESFAWVEGRMSVIGVGSRLFLLNRPAADKDDQGRGLAIAVRNLRDDDVVCDIAVLDLDTRSSKRVTLTRRSLNAMLKDSGFAKEADAAWLKIVLVEPSGDGAMLLGLRTLAEVTTTTTTTRTSSSGVASSSSSTAVTWNAGDLVLVQITSAAELEWVRKVDMDAVGYFSDTFALGAALRGAELQLLYRDRDCGTRGMALCTRTINMATGEASPARMAAPFFPSGAVWVPELSAPLADHSWLLGIQEGPVGFRGARLKLGKLADQDTTLLARVDPSAPSPSAARRQLAPTADPSSLDYRSGAVFGRMAILEGQRGMGARGFGLGLAAGAGAGTLIGWAVTGLSDSPSASFFLPLTGGVVGGTLTAHYVIKPRHGWFTTRSPQFQSGYVENSRARRATFGGMYGGFIGGFIPTVVFLVRDME